MNIFKKIKNIFSHKYTEEEMSRIEREEIEEFNFRQEQYDRMLQNEVQKQRYLNKLYSAKSMTFTKKMVTIIISICLIDIQIPYVLALLGKESTVEDLSSTLCITILGVAFAYIVRAYFDSKAIHSTINGDTQEQITDNVIDEVKGILSNAGINIDMDRILKDKLNDRLTAGLHINKSEDDDSDPYIH